MPAVKVATKSAPSPAKRSASTKPRQSGAAKKAAAAVEPTVVKLIVDQMPKGKGGVRFREVFTNGELTKEGSEILRTLYVAQTEFARLGLADGDVVEVTITKSSL